MNTKFEFSAGPWNINPGDDPFGPAVRNERELIDKALILKKMGFNYIQLHDDDAVPMDVPCSQVTAEACKLKGILDDIVLQVEFIAPRLWFDPRFADGAITANNADARQVGLDRAKRSVDIMLEVGCNRMVLWPAREGTYIRESKCALRSFDLFLEYLNAILAYGPDVRILGEMKPNEPMDLMYLPSTAHFITMAERTSDPSRVGVLIEAAHSILLGLDPSDEMAFAIWNKKLWGVHLNDQNGLKFDQDKSFGSVDIRRAFNVVDLLVRTDWGTHGEVVGLDVKAMRTQPFDRAIQHLSNSKEMFERLVGVAVRIDRQEWKSYVDNCDYEGLDMFILRNLVKE